MASVLISLIADFQFYTITVIFFCTIDWLASFNLLHC